MPRFYLIFVSTYFFSFSSADRIVTTKVGQIRGYLSEDGYYQFLGIPYGVVDANNPFGISTPREELVDATNVFDANSDAVHCPQPPTVNGTVTGVIDCLTLNIYVPNITPDNLPVLMWTYGGFFHFGHASKSVLNPKFLTRHGVIVITYNYRTGPYGFMCLNRPDVPGNQGLRDQYLAMQWVRENIEAFGGDRARITLGGDSAGGHAVNLHFHSEKEILFHKAIIVSGSAYAATLLYTPDRRAPVKLAQNLGFEGTSVAAALRFLTQSNPEEVMTAAGALNIYYKPCVERAFDDVEPYIARTFINESVPQSHNIPIIIGTTEHERALSHLNQGPEHFANLNIFDNYLRHSFDLDNKTQARMELYLRRFYNGDDPINQENVWNIINFDSDFVYNYPVQRSIKKFLEYNNELYYYMFSYVGGRNSNVGNVASHGSDMRYLFDRYNSPTPVSAADQLIIDRMTTLFTNFVKSSSPNSETGTTDLLPVYWTALNNQTYNYLKIDTNLTLERRPNHRRMAFMELFYRLNEGHQRLFEPSDEIEDDDEDDSSATAKIATSSMIMFLLTLLFILKV